MPRKRHTAEEIIKLLRLIEIEIQQGRTAEQACKVKAYRFKVTTAGVRNTVV